MSQHTIPAFYFPTTVVFVDDSKDFLSNLSLQLAPDLAFRLFDSPAKALELLNSGGSSCTPIERLFSRYHDTDDLPMTHHVIDVNLARIYHEIYNEFRFANISVAVVDYDMPGTDGLELFRKIQNPAIKKILLTGKADEKVAVQAFNEGLINRFILKQEADVVGTLNQAISDLQLAYFRQNERMLADALAIGKHVFLRDPVFAETFRGICTKLRIVEYYLCSEPDGILMLDANGKSHLLLVPSDDAMQGQYEIAEVQNAPQELLDALKSKQVLPYFWQTEGHYAPECLDWRRFLYPAAECRGLRSYYYSVITNPPLHKTDIVFSYRDFLNELDRA